MQWRQGTIIPNVCKFENNYWTSKLINCWWKEGCVGEEVCTGFVWCYILADNCGHEPCIISGCDRENLWVCSWWRCKSPSEARSCELVNVIPVALGTAKAIQRNKHHSAAAVESAGRHRGEKSGGRLRLAPLCQLCGCEKFVHIPWIKNMLTLSMCYESDHATNYSRS